ncbi:MAG: efflux RND transporter periplasmic adaptor subunit [Isosphaeraceae bacterium]|nr:efflux RND transporter periplasmic adaptor subunit [Isosphaeraceae bacterium]
MTGISFGRGPREAERWAEAGPTRDRGHGMSIYVVALALATFPAGCGPGNVYHEPPPPEVVVACPLRRTVTSYLEHTGTAQPSERVELRARVRGFLKERHFEDGAPVKAGQLLFVIDEEPFRVRVDQATAKREEAEAALKKAERSKAREVAKAQLDLDLSQLTLAQLEEGRTRSLLSRNAGSREDLDRAEANRKKLEAQVESDRANLEQSEADYDINILSARSSLDAARADARNAKIDLGYCRIASPIDGRINAREFDVGNYVGEGNSIVLATVIKTDPIYAYVTVSEDDLFRVQGMIRAGKTAASREQSVPMQLGLGNEPGYPEEGRIDYTDPSVDTGTGTLRVRGVFPNPDGKITPGLFVRVRVPFERIEGALLVPERALGSDQAGTFLLVVGPDDKVERRTVRLGIQDGPLRVVEGKLGATDRVVVDGLLRARPGLKVSPKLDGTAAQGVAAAETASGPAR